jgi:hypothetical protein
MKNEDNCVYCGKKTNSKVLDIPYCKKHSIKKLLKILK